MFKKAIAILTVLLIFTLPSCDTNGKQKENASIKNQNQIPITELNKTILKEIENCKIVMLGDAYHGHGFFMNKLTRLLDYWINQYQNQKNISVPNKLVLFLETDEFVADQINKFIESGDISSFLKYYIEYDSDAMSNVFTHDFCIFLHKLREIKTRISHLNNNSSVDLKIVGAEASFPYQHLKINSEEFLRKKQLYFAYERDKLASNNIKKFMSDNPEYKAIVFYGGAHLIREKVDKNNYISRQVLSKPLNSYFLAHYLDSLYTRKQVRVFFERPIFDFKYENILKIPGNGSKPDYYVSTKAYPNYPFPMSFARSKTYFRAISEVIQKYNDTEKDRIKRNLVFNFTNGIMHTYLSAGINVRNDLSDIAQEVLKRSDQLIQEYDALEFFERCDEGLTSNFTKRLSYFDELYKVLSNIPAFALDPNTIQSLNKEELPADIRQKIKKHKEDISIYWAIHTLFIADQNESKEILRYLSKKINTKNKSKTEWLNWWYEKYKTK